MGDEGKYTHCDVCGRRYEPGAPADGWLEVTVEGDGGYASPDFCSQAHAVRWFSESSLPLTAITIKAPTARDRLADIALALPFIAVAAFTLIGLWTVISWI
ncbi:hypothetical protein PWY87_06365 [Kribbella solani]|uniref:hypothetical protein n=1 Tax=Kribbella solani TaxID=236067 RepID=UPI0029B44E76|nr:hypothetical protein [Kribbella solani]MDX2969066.1 hypothetical protein [Kribbella solani]MDX3001283.1 hypothetical protein [Kribbella solani]